MESRLATLLLELYDDEEIRRLVRDVAGDEGARALPSGDAVPRATLADRASAILLRRGLVGGGLFARMVRDRPARNAEIRAVASVALGVGTTAAGPGLAHQVAARPEGARGGLPLPWLVAAIAIPVAAGLLTSSYLVAFAAGGVLCAAVVIVVGQAGGLTGAGTARLVAWPIAGSIAGAVASMAPPVIGPTTTAPLEVTSEPPVELRAKTGGLMAEAGDGLQASDPTMREHELSRTPKPPNKGETRTTSEAVRVAKNGDPNPSTATRVGEGEPAAEACLRAKIWDGYQDEWVVRSATVASLSGGDHRTYLVTLYAGNTYRILACGDDLAVNIDLGLYDAKGNLQVADSSADREPMLEFVPPTTDTYYIAVYAEKLVNARVNAGIATALTYK